MDFTSRGTYLRPIRRATSAMPDGYLLAMTTCEVDGKQDETIVAAVRGSEVEEWLEDVIWARRFDVATGKFVERVSTGVRCLNEGWGL